MQPLDLNKEIYCVLNVEVIIKNMVNYHLHLNHPPSVLARLLPMLLLLLNHQVECVLAINQKKRYIIIAYYKKLTQIHLNIINF